MNKLIFTSSFVFCFVCSSAQQIEKLTIYFKFDKYELNVASKSKLDSSIQNKFIQKIHIEAHCDSLGTNEYNDLLALKRALEVKKHFVFDKISDSLIDTKALGKRFPLNNNLQASNRRADINIIYEVSGKKILSSKNSSELNTQKTDSGMTKNKLISINDSLAKNKLEMDINNTVVGASFKLENMNFYGGRHKLLPQSEPTLHLLLTALKENLTLEIQIQGHVCCLQGNADGYDFETGAPNLSVVRAKAVYDYLVKNGIDAKRLSYVGFGASHKLVEEHSEQDLSTNRRVEIKIIKR